MTTGPILDLAGVGKSYRSYSSTWMRAAGWISGRATHFTDHWVLRDVTFSLRRGEAVGIVGRNGAGKTTLLKLIARTLMPTEGSVAAHGRISAILELGMGFNPEFTGRENVAHACGLLGYDTVTIADLALGIESFSDIGSYFDQPVRTYSTGMTMRVAFAVVTALRPDILIVDEALSVGDASFQRKSIRRIEEFLAQGTTLLFVSHGTESVKALCERALWIEQGRLAMDGSAKVVTEAYEKSLFSTLATPAAEEGVPRGYFDQTLLNAPMEQQYGDGSARITDVRFVDQGGQPVNAIRVGEPFSVQYVVEFAKSCSEAHFGMLLKTLEGITVYGTNTDRAGLRSSFKAGERIRLTYSLRNNLCPGLYFLNCGASGPTTEGRDYMHRRVDVAVLKVFPRKYDENVTGLAYLEGTSRLQLLETVHE